MKPFGSLFVGGLVATSLSMTAFCARPALATTENHLRYEVQWGGLHAADFILSFDHAAQDAQNRFQLVTRGLTQWLTRLSINVSSDGLRQDGVAFSPRHFRLDYSNKRRERTVTVTFDPNGGAAVPHIETKGASDEQDDGKEELVPPEMRIGTIDPLSALVETLARTRDHLEGGAPSTFTLKVYDGRRRFDVDCTVLGRDTREILRTRKEVYEVSMIPKPVAGFKESHKILWSTFDFVLYLSTDGRYVPLQIEARGPGPMINLVQECPDRDTCLVPLKEE
ncbi:MAG: DUF3108 domain-containing protein [Rhodospirillales bacterium]|nr:DUF3108 domain-containing protein [Rhodospirillales bacterium]